MKTTITIDIDGDVMAVKEENCTGCHYTINADDDERMIHDICGQLELYLRYEREEEPIHDYYDYEHAHKNDILDKDSFVGEHVISGCTYYNDDDGFSSMVFILDGKTILAACDPDDGYRSYLGAFFSTKRPCPKNLPDINIEIQHKVVREEISAFERRDYKGYVFVIKDPRYKEDLLMELGTDYSEDYYPCCVMHYMPENIKEVEQ